MQSNAKVRRVESHLTWAHQTKDGVLVKSVLSGFVRLWTNRQMARRCAHAGERVVRVRVTVEVVE